MAAVPIYVWNGTAWQETGPTIPANPIKYQASAPSSPSTGDIWVDSDGDVTTGSQQFQRFRFVVSGGETTISGSDANGAVLAYTAGLEQVVLNGAVLVRGFDYTATTGTTITGLSPALVASDVLEVFSFIAFSVANTYTQAQVDGAISTAAVFKNGTTSYQEGSVANPSGTAWAASSGTDPSVTLTTGTKVLIMVSARIQCVGNYNFCGFEISGATTLAGNDAYSANVGGVSAYIQSSYIAVHTVNAGSNTFTMKYRCNTSASGNYQYRSLTVIPLN